MVASGGAPRESEPGYDNAESKENREGPRRIAWRRDAPTIAPCGLQWAALCPRRLAPLSDGRLHRVGSRLAPAVAPYRQRKSSHGPITAHAVSNVSSRRLPVKARRGVARRSAGCSSSIEAQLRAGRVAGMPLLL